MFIKATIKNFGLLCLSLLLSMLVAEGICRFVFDPVDFLIPTIVDDEWLQYRITPNSGGHDEFGFRNKEVPQNAKIVAIGDSNTYGLAATRSDAWPNQLAKRTGDTVYNMGLGGYGPLQYLKLLQTQAMELNPEIVLVGLYFGNDFVDTYQLVYLQDKWKQYRNEQITFDKIASKVVDDSRRARRLSGLRNWLSRNSVFYRILTGALGPALREYQSDHMQEEGRAYFRPERGSVIRFNALMLEHALNFTRPEVAEGFRLSMQGVSEIKSFCDENDIKLLVLMIPTKELVYSDLIINSEDQPQKEIFSNIVASENLLRDKVFLALERDGINHVDLLPAFAENAVTSQIYPTFNTHPNALGYSIIANTVAHKLEALQY